MIDQVKLTTAVEEYKDEIQYIHIQQTYATEAFKKYKQGSVEYEHAADVWNRAKARKEQAVQELMGIINAMID